jgi:hypothetical protein
MNWINLAQNKVQRQAFMTTVKNFHKRRILFWLAERLLASQEGLCSMELCNFVFEMFGPY